MGRCRCDFEKVNRYSKKERFFSCVPLYKFVYKEDGLQIQRVKKLGLQLAPLTVGSQYPTNIICAFNQIFSYPKRRLTSPITLFVHHNCCF